MLATKNSPRKAALLLALATLAGLTGCTPPGPRALLEGDALLRAGKPDQAIAELKQATELLPGEPRAWNLLGLAYHRTGQLAPATQAYRQALLRDRSNLVTVAHFNLGCLLLEQNLPVGAVDALRSYTLLTNSPVGFARLGSAQLRLRQFTEAEKSFATALRVDPKNADALNGWGVARAQRGQRDAAQYFAAALQAEPKYSPALLNAAVLAQQHPATRPVALQHYRDYLATRANGTQVEAVKRLVQQLELELTPVKIPAPAIAPVPVKTNAPAAGAPAVVVANTNPPARPPTAPVKTNLSVTLTKTNAPIALIKTNPVVTIARQPAPPPTNVPVTVVAVTEPSPPKIATAEPPVAKPAPTPTVVPRPAPVAEVTPPPAPTLNDGPAPGEKKRGFFSRLNPFGGPPKPVPATPASRTIVLNPDATPATATASRATGEKPVFPRYRYTSPAPPPVGDRAAGDRDLQQALAAQRAGRTSEARTAYASALVADPGSFEAQYNSALFAFQSGETIRALAGWETALALQPESINARYSFALTLKQAGYATDATQELERIIEAKPDDARAHLALGNLYAQQLLAPAQARAHYKKLLELDPRNPQAAAIRFWLSANP